MKSLLLAGAMIVATGTAAFADGLLLGGRQWRDQQMRHRDQQSRHQRASRRQYLVRDGPYKSIDDAKLARSTIDACPEEEPIPPRRTE